MLLIYNRDGKGERREGRGPGVKGGRLGREEKGEMGDWGRE